MNNLSKLAWTATPLFLILLCIGLYIAFDLYFVRGCDKEAANAIVNANVDEKTRQAAKGCGDPIDSAMISNVQNAETHDVSKKRLVTLGNTSENVSKQLAEQSRQLTNLQANLDEKATEINNLNTALANFNSANIINVNKDINFNATAATANLTRLGIIKTEVSEQLTMTNANITRLNGELTKTSNTALAIRQQYAGRYSSRMLWIFLTALFIALSALAVAVGAHVIFKCSRIFISDPPINPAAEPASSFKILKDSFGYLKSISYGVQDSEIRRANQRTFWWIVAAAAVSVIFLIFIFIWKKEFMSVALPMLEQTVIGVENVDLNTLISFTVCGYVGAIFLIAASYAVFRAAVKVDDAVPKKDSEIVPPKVYVKVELPDSQPTFEEKLNYVETEPNTTPPTYMEASKEFIKVEDTDAKLEIYARLIKYLRTILYVGTFLLVVGILRIIFMMNWHLSFISTNPQDKLVELLTGFWKSSMTIQGGFYTILLAAIYLPAAYWISGRIERLGKEKGELEAQGVNFKYTELIFKLLAIVSPLLVSGFGSATNWLDIFGGG